MRANAPPRPSRPPRRQLPKLGPSEAAIYETFVVPRYMSLFGELLQEMLVEGSDAQVVHLNCRTAYPDREVLARLPGAHLYGVDPSPYAVELARAKAQTVPDVVANYSVAEAFPVNMPDGAFSHGYALHPLVVPDERKRLFSELARLVAPQGQALAAMPMRGSFLEIADLLREYALKHELPNMGQAIEAAVLLRPTVDDLVVEMKACGFDFVDVELRPATLTFQSGRDFFEDPITRLVCLPDMAANLGIEPSELEVPFSYVRAAVDKYYSFGPFTLSVNVGCVSGRRVG